MTRTLLRDVVDTYSNEARPAENFGKAGLLRLDAAGTAEKRVFLFASGGPRPGTYVLDATLSLFARQPWAGSQNVTVRRIIETWKERTLTWRRSPDSTADSAATQSVGPLANKAEVEFDVTDIVRDAFLGTGVPFYGFEIRGEDAGDFTFWSSEADDPAVRPRLEIHYTVVPAAAYDLVPGDADVVSIAKPVLRWTFFDPDGEEQQAFVVEADPTNDFETPAFNSGEITSTDPQLDLALTAIAAITDGGDLYWRVMVQDASGQWGPWSDIVQISRVSKGSLTINSPTSEIEETTPTIATVLSTRDLRAIEYFLEEDIFASGGIGDEVIDGWGDLDWGSGPWGSVVVASFGNVLGSTDVWHEARFKAEADAGDEFEFDVPKKTIRRRTATYKLTVRTWDTIENRVHTPGDPNYLEEFVVFSWVDPSAPPAPVTSFVAAPESAGGPGISLTWTRAAVPDTWKLMVDGRVEEDKVDATEWQIGGTSYGVTYYAADPSIEHEFEIVAVVNVGGVGVTSSGNPTALATSQPIGIWLISGDVATTAEPQTRFQMLGDADSPAAIGESRERLTPVGRQAPVDIVDSIRGYEDTLQGVVQSPEDRITLETIKASPTARVRLVMGDMSIPVRLGEISIGRFPNVRGLYPVSVEIAQVADFPIRARIR